MASSRPALLLLHVCLLSCSGEFLSINNAPFPSCLTSATEKLSKKVKRRMKPVHETDAPDKYCFWLCIWTPAQFPRNKSAFLLVCAHMRLVAWACLNLRDNSRLNSTLFQRLSPQILVVFSPKCRRRKTLKGVINYRVIDAVKDQLTSQRVWTRLLSREGCVCFKRFVS